MTGADAVCVRRLEPGDLEGVLALNQAWVPHVGSLDPDRLAALVRASELSLVAEAPRAGLVGFVVVMGADADYDSPNYQWFAQRHERFTYVDRIAVATDARGAGLGRMLYGLVRDHARSCGSPVVCAEVNLEPPNPDSQRFHQRRGFQEAGRQWTYDHTVQVQLLELAI